jgi:hypothetical protein
VPHHDTDAVADHEAAGEQPAQVFGLCTSAINRKSCTSSADISE